MDDLDRDTATAYAPGYDGSAEVLRQRQLALQAYIDGLTAPGAGIAEDIEESYYGGGMLSRANAPLNTELSGIE